MFERETRKSSADRYLAIVKSKRTPFLNPRMEDMEALIETAQGELFFNFGSEFLNACYSVWQRYTRRIGIQDCT